MHNIQNMTPVVPSSISNVLPIPGTPFITRKNECLKRCNLVRNSTKQIWSSQKYILPLSTSARLFPQFRTGFALRHKLSATGTDLAVEEADSTISDEDLVSTSEASSVKSEPIAGPTQSKRSKPTRKSEMPPVNPEELVPGATFTGKVRSIQPFGAFVDFGAFTDGLVHVSRLSDSFVKDVGNVVTVGQEVTVRLVEANTETGRISLTMRESDDISKLQQRKDSPPSAEKSRQPRKGPPRSNQKRDEAKKTSKFVKGQDLEGSVKNLTRSGAFISLPEGEEGFLPQSEEVDEGFANMMGGSSLQVGQEVSVRVLRISRGQVTLTMKKEEGAGELDSKLNQGIIHTATSPFLLAFRKNKDIASFLDEREKEEEPSETKLEIEGDETSSKGVDLEASAEEELELLEESPSTSGQDNEKGAQIADDNESLEILVSDTLQSVASEEVAGSQADDVIVKDEVQVPPPDVVNDISSPTIPEDEETEAIPDNNGTLTSSDGQIDAPTSQQSTIEENEVSEEVENVIDTPAADNEIPSATLVEDAKVESAPEEENVESSVPPTNGSTTKENEVSEEVENVIDTPAADNEIPSAAPVEDAKVESAPEEENVESSVPPTNGSTTKENEVSKEVENVIETPAADSEILSAAPVEEAKVESASEEKSIITASNEESSVPPTNGSTPKATISPALVKQLREETGAGMMDCKKALSETGGDLVKAQEFLRKKGLASADKKASRATAEGRIGSYIHDSRIGVLIEVNCETDFVSRGEIFKGLVDDLAMQVAACPQVQYLVTEDVDKEIVEKEREIEMQKEDLLLKPEQIRSKIVEGRINKRLEELALLEQPYIKNDKVVVKDWVKQTISTIGENIKVKRFVRFNLGEGLEKKSQDFAAEVAAQTAAKSVPSPGKEQPAVVEEKPVVDNTPKVTVSAALVKQLREETGAGMMDCKKALSETGGDLEKAQEYLRKKGLASADKKSSRLAAEGRIGSYIHDSRIGVLIEVNCETDFVGRSEKFKELVDDLAMQVAACPQVQHVSIEDIPESIVQKEKELEMQREDLQLKPENIREKIVEGRVTKRLGELALLEQPFIKDDSVLVKDLVKQTVAALGENIKVRRFVRFTLGETNESSETEKEA